VSLRTRCHQAKAKDKSLQKTQRQDTIFIAAAAVAAAHLFFGHH